MPIEIAWEDDAHTILLQTIVGEYTIQDYQAMVDESVRWMRQEDHAVHIISDFRRAGSTPVNALAGARHAEKHMAPNQGLVIFVGANALVQTFVNVARRAGLKVVQDVRMVTTLEAAYQIIAEEGAGVQ